MFSSQDRDQIEKLGKTPEQVLQDMITIEEGYPALNIIRAATLGDGIQGFDQEQQNLLASYFDQKILGLECVKFVPASGAASRMFQFLFDFLTDYDPDQTTLKDYFSHPDHQDVQIFFKGLADFPFTNAIRSHIRGVFPDFKTWSKGHRFYCMVEVLLLDNGLNYGALPKGLIPFHKYKKYATTAFEEQLYEAAYYAATGQDLQVHFTFSEHHLTLFKTEFDRIKTRLKRANKSNTQISYSFQKTKTQTLAVTLENRPFRDDEGHLLFRPSGHGALIENLNDIDADVVFIKNIDNVIAQDLVPEMAFYKKVLAGHLLQIQDTVFNYLRGLQKTPKSVDLNAIHGFLWNTFGIKNLPNGPKELTDLLNRPIRVCGVVANTGAPGGGPFWVRHDQDKTTLQILEASQFDAGSSRQRDILQQATHFNPVDLVCGLRDFNGDKFDLMAYRDPQMGFISEKSYRGKQLKALELPGLWNGAMANWHTVFVAVPLSTFNPVKTVNDLLQKPHRPLA